MRLRRKITIAFFLVSSLVSLLLAVFLYRFVERQLKDDLRARLRDIAHLGSRSLDLEAYDRLRGQLAPRLDPAAVATVEHSADYRRIFDQLNTIRATEPALLRYAYVLARTDDPDQPRFIADADVLTAKAGEAISHFAQPYDVSAMPGLRRALQECVPVVEREFVWDPAFKVYSVSAYFPVAAPAAHGGGPGSCAGVLGVDITDQNMRAALAAAGSLAIKLSLAVIALALVISIAMGTMLTRSLLALSATVKQFADKDFAVRSSVASRDEIGLLGSNFNAMAETIQAHSENLEHLVDLRTRELTAEKQTSERLLLNVLPGAIAERLKLGDGVIVDRFEAVTVLFADIVGFTALSQRTSPEALVTMLDELFTSFDRLAEEHGLEKIKTIGDCYMVVAGIPEATADHAERMTRMGLAMLGTLADYSRRNQTELTIRIGVHSGSVVAGVIGRKKFIYDLWGDTVNTASRMESHGVPGRVHITESTYQYLKATFDCEARGIVEIKGKGPMQTYLVIGPRAAGPGAATAPS